MHIGFCWGHLKEGELALYERIILKWGIVNMMGRMWTGLIWLRIGSNGRLL
jgi:hypothetical protein